MKANELRELSKEELLQKYKEFKEELFKLKFQLLTKQLENPMKIRRLRREIARLLTVMREKELEARG